MAAIQRPNTPLESNVESGGNSNNVEEVKNLDDAYYKLRLLLKGSVEKKDIESIIASINLYSASLSELGLQPTHRVKRKENFLSVKGWLEEFRQGLSLADKADFDVIMDFINKEINEKERVNSIRRIQNSWHSNYLGGRRKEKTRVRKTRKARKAKKDLKAEKIL
jgi:hypothetical protein